ncbi:hypothetical protein NDU88_002407 [Pleurodeles waltl]|uniref:Uncharacterized protein n=1 Tax=Pleurodeles waltl TaxID=8319 RepID=A0AAV7P9V2_PLEWA|nr:hypothetical protein NDU88_002407 [Pleurodeles waltl]
MPGGHTPWHHQLFRLPAAGQDPPPLLLAPVGPGLPATEIIPHHTALALQQMQRQGCPGLSCCGRGPARTARPKRGPQTAAHGGRALPAVFTAIAQQESGGVLLPERGHRHSSQLQEAASVTTNCPPCLLRTCSKPRPPHHLSQLQNRQGAERGQIGCRAGRA